MNDALKKTRHMTQYMVEYHILEKIFSWVYCAIFLASAVEQSPTPDKWMNSGCSTADTDQTSNALVCFNEFITGHI